MAIRDKLQANVQPHLAAGETIQAVFCAQTISAYFALISYWIIVARNSYRVVAATDRRILVFSSGRLTTAQAKTLVGEYPRVTRLGPPHGLWYKCEALGEPLYINRRFHKDVEAADAVLGGAPAV
jgi:hypothetical protein